MAKISVVVPVYKVEQFIHRCVDSILNQTYRDFELILVDDGSPDLCGEICERYAGTDQRVIVLHRKNGGLSAARNTGIEWSLEHSDSEWITFIDSDDWVHSRYLESLLEAVVSNDVSVGVSLHRRTGGENPEVDEANLKASLVDPQDLYCKDYTQFITAWGKIYRKSGYEEIRFPEGKLHEDEFTTWKILFKYERIAVIEEPLYAYYYNPDGIMNSNWNIKRVVGLDAQEERLQFLSTNQRLRNAWIKTVQVVACTMAGYIEIIEKNDLSGCQPYSLETRKKLRTYIWKNRKYIPFKGYAWVYRKAFPRLIKYMLWGAEMRDKIESHLENERHR